MGFCFSVLSPSHKSNRRININVTCISLSSYCPLSIFIIIFITTNNTTTATSFFLREERIWVLLILLCFICCFVIWVSQQRFKKAVMQRVCHGILYFWFLRLHFSFFSPFSCLLEVLGAKSFWWEPLFQFIDLQFFNLLSLYLYIYQSDGHHSWT